MNPELYERLQKLADLGIAQSFLEKVSLAMLAGRVTEEEVVNYICEKEDQANSSKYARPRHGFSRVRGRSAKKSQFWYK